MLGPQAELVIDPHRIREMYTEHFAAVLGTQPALAEEDPFATIPLHAGSAMPSIDLMGSFTRDEIHSTLVGLRGGLAPGVDLLRPEYYRIAADIIAQPLCDLFNRILETGEWPDVWRRSLLCPIPKPGVDPRALGNLRPISLQPVAARIFCNLLARRLQEAVASRLHPAQFGFLRNHSTMEPLLTMRLALEHAYFQRTPLRVLSLDITKAYDTVPWLRLSQAMKRVGLTDRFAQLIQRMHQGAESAIKTAVGITAPFQQRRGVLQGSPLSCMLFLIFLDPLLCKLDTSLATDSFVVSCGSKISQRVPVLAYADDVAILTRSTAAAQSALVTAEALLTECGMELNVRKSECFSAQELPVDASLTSASGVSLLWQSYFTYLGVEFERGLVWTRQRGRLFQHIGKCTASLNRRSLTAAQAAYLVRAVLFPALLYRLSITCPTPSIVQRLQSRCEQLVRARAWLPN